MTNSRDVAELFGKRHADVLRALDGLECSASFRERNFALTEEHQIIGAAPRLIRSIDMTKDGFVFLVMGFTGKQAAAFKEAYINRFNEMEERLRPQFASTGIGRHVMREFISPEGVPLRALATEQGIMVVGADFVKVVYVAARERHVATKRGLMPARWADYPSP